MIHILFLSVAVTVSTARQPSKEGGHHPNSVYSQISAYTKKDLRIFYQNGVSERAVALVRLPTPGPVKTNQYSALAGYFYQYCRILTVSQSESSDAAG